MRIGQTGGKKKFLQPEQNASTLAVSQCSLRFEAIYKCSCGMSCLHTSCMSIRQYAIYHIISLNRLCLQFSMAYVMCLYIIPVKGRHLRCANCRHLDSFCCFHSLSALGRHRSEVRHRKLTSCLKEGSRV